MKCPHCRTAFHDNRQETHLGSDKVGEWSLLTRMCPECGKFIFGFLRIYKLKGDWQEQEQEILSIPRGISRAVVPKEVPSEFAEDYTEACAVLADSAKASAALSRRCLQHMLREKAGIKKGNLADEIQEVIDTGKLPSHLSESLDAIRNIGNFAAHPIKSKASSEVIDVEPGEAEWNLDVIESLFDYFFVQPTTLQKKKAALNAKLKEAGKPEMK